MDRQVGLELLALVCLVEVVSVGSSASSWFVVQVELAFEVVVELAEIFVAEVVVVVECDLLAVLKKRLQSHYRCRCRCRLHCRLVFVASFVAMLMLTNKM